MKGQLFVLGPTFYLSVEEQHGVNLPTPAHYTPFFCRHTQMQSMQPRLCQPWFR